MILDCYIGYTLTVILNWYFIDIRSRIMLLKTPFFNLKNYSVSLSIWSKENKVKLYKIVCVFYVILIL